MAAGALVLSCLSVSAEALAQEEPGAPPPGAPVPPEEASPDAVAPDAAPAAKPEEGKKNGVYADLGLGVLGIGYERVFGESIALNLTLHYYRPWYISDHVFGFGGELRAFVFVTDVAPEGLYFSPGVRVDYARAELDPEDLGPERAGEDTEFEGGAWGAKITVGYGVLLFDVLSARLGLGVQAHAADLASGPGEPDFGGAYPAIDFLAGAAF
jgi:hypothetical protein